MIAQYETFLDNVFSVEKLISIHHGLVMSEQKTFDYEQKNGGVIYNFWQLYFLEAGSYDVQMEACPLYHMQQGQLLICEPEKIRYSFGQKDAVVGIINIRCPSAKMKQLKNRVFTLSEDEQKTIYHILDKGSNIFQDMPDIPKEKPHYGQIPQNGTQDYELQILKNHIELLLISLYEHCNNVAEKKHPLQNQQNYYDAQFHTIECYLKEHLYDTLSVQDLCVYAGISESTLKRIFQQQLNCGAIHYYLKLKIHESKRLLNETHMTVTQISDLLKFSSVHYFSRIFKKFVGVSPSQYVKSQSITAASFHSPD